LHPLEWQLASLHGQKAKYSLRIQTSRSSSVVRITGIALGCIGLATPSAPSSKIHKQDESQELGLWQGQVICEVSWGFVEIVPGGLCPMQESPSSTAQVIRDLAATEKSPG
jgi:hypothetical protein